ncbi:hypothetical protein L873DRAFT_1095463 [Choiromyces venosus 120613-1]|uniref:Uncharacterized protein n=1 Tax=Choiromyces venosus 120613-1 TaxID=1336337 RepID=A0A3N4JHW9_9PEZI|nr:hypothetical protein L873DRAFT_1095463 [Choiromyces venosus 120613-1]
MIFIFLLFHPIQYISTYWVCALVWFVLVYKIKVLSHSNLAGYTWVRLNSVVSGAFVNQPWFITRWGPSWVKSGVSYRTLLKSPDVKVLVNYNSKLNLLVHNRFLIQADE